MIQETELQPATGQVNTRYEVLSKVDLVPGRDCFLAYRAGGAGYRKLLLLTRISRRFGSDSAFLQHFSVTTGLNQKNIASVFDLSLLAGELHVVNEFVMGASVEQIAAACERAGAELPLGLVIKLVRDAATALQYAHQYATPLGEKKPIIHGALCASNVLLTYAGMTKVVDFGLPRPSHLAPSVPWDVRGLGMLLGVGLTAVSRHAPLNEQWAKTIHDLTDLALAYAQAGDGDEACTALGFSKIIDELGGDLAWTDEQAGEFLCTLFAEQRAQVRELIELHSAIGPRPARSVTPEPTVMPPPVSTLTPFSAPREAVPLLPEPTRAPLLLTAVVEPLLKEAPRAASLPIPLTQMVASPSPLTLRDLRPLIAAASLLIGGLVVLGLGHLL